MGCEQEGTRMTRLQHVLRVLLLSSLAASVLCTIVARTDLIFQDGVRYIEQARRISRGAFSDGVLRSTDHPGYPLLITAVHGLTGGESRGRLAEGRPDGGGLIWNPPGRPALPGMRRVART